MPYIKQAERGRLGTQHITPPHNPGELAYVLSQVVDSYLKGFSHVNYATHAEVIGVLETLKLEIYRRFTAPYEDKKRSENGDAFFSFPTTYDGKVM